MTIASTTRKSWIQNIWELKNPDTKIYPREILRTGIFKCQIFCICDFRVYACNVRQCLLKFSTFFKCTSTKYVLSIFTEVELTGKRIIHVSFHWGLDVCKYIYISDALYFSRNFFDLKNLNNKKNQWSSNINGEYFLILQKKNSTCVKDMFRLIEEEENVVCSISAGL